MTRRVKHLAPWRVRREDYLRSSGRQSALIKEGFDPAPSTDKWTLIVGGRVGRSPSATSSARLFVIEKAAERQTPEA
jgi:hypothetical protein